MVQQLRRRPDSLVGETWQKKWTQRGPGGEAALPAAGRLRVGAEAQKTEQSRRQGLGSHLYRDTTGLRVGVKSLPGSVQSEKTEPRRDV